MNGKVRLALIAALIASLLAVHFLSERVEVEVDAGPTTEARINPFLAAFMFLEARDVSVSEYLLAEAPLAAGGVDTLVISASRRSVDSAFSERLYDWVFAGGKLVVAAEEDDELLQYWFDLDVVDELRDEVDDCDVDGAVDDCVDTTEQTAADSQDSFSKQAVDSTKDQAIADKTGSQYCHLYPKEQYDADGIGPMELLSGYGLGTHRIVDLLAEVETPPGEMTLSDEQGVWLHRRTVGAGSVVVLTTWSQWERRLIGCSDHALLLHSLLSGAEDVGWVRRIQAQHWLAMLWRDGALALGTGALLLFLLIWRWNVRFGPTIDVAVVARRALSEHLQAVGSLLWQQSAQEALLSGLRDDLRAEFNAHGLSIDAEHGWRWADDVQRSALLNLIGINERELTFLMSVIPTRESEFTDVVRQLSALRERLG